MIRAFYVDTPLGKLRIASKHEVDHPEDFPGVWIELVHDESEYGDLLVCVEYESTKGELQCVVYQSADEDEPSHVIPYELPEGLDCDPASY